MSDLHKVITDGLTIMLKSCPFCGSRDVAPLYRAYQETMINCRDCYARGPDRSNLDKAIEAWNDRKED